MDVPTDWMKVEANGKFTFWLPATLTEVNVQAIDSYVRRWEGNDMIVYFDYGRFSDPLTFYARKKAYETTMEQIGGYSATIVSFQRDGGWWLTAVHFPDVGRDPFGQIVKLTLVVESGAEVGKEGPLRIVKSIRFG